MKAVVIELLDIVSVRDGRSFDAGGASLARALWPPTPWTVLGAIRARMVMALGQDPSEYGGRGWTSGADTPGHLAECVRRIGRPEDPPRFALGPVLLRRDDGEELFPAPLDLVSVASSGQENPARLRPVEAWRFERAAWSGLRRGGLLFPPDEGHPGKKPPFRHLTSKQAKEWLEGSVPQTRTDETPVVAESRIGIALDPNTGRVQEGMFYQRRGYALAYGWRLAVPFLDIPEDLEGELSLFDGLGEMGGDRHPARFSLADFEWPESPLRGEDKAVLWFLTPVQSGDLTDERLTEVAKSPVKVLAVASGRPVSIGGWRMWRGANRPRPMRRYHPAGTCVYVEGDASALQGRSVASDREERAAGFGVCLCGAWPRQVLDSGKEV